MIKSSVAIASHLNHDQKKIKFIPLESGDAYGLIFQNHKAEFSWFLYKLEFDYYSLLKLTISIDNILILLFLIDEIISRDS